MTLKYIGNGFLRGIPKRDLSDAEVEKHGGEDFLIGTGLYEREQQAPAAPPKEPKRKNKNADWKQLAEEG